MNNIHTSPFSFCLASVLNEDGVSVAWAALDCNKQILIIIYYLALYMSPRSSTWWPSQLCGIVPDITELTSLELLWEVSADRLSYLGPGTRGIILFHSSNSPVRFVRVGLTRMSVMSLVRISRWWRRRRENSGKKWVTCCCPVMVIMALSILGSHGC